MTTVQMTSDITVELVAATATDTMVCNAARVSTLGAALPKDTTSAGLVSALMREGHGSPFEHTFFSFRVHAPLFVMTEHLRHRAGWSYNGESGRYKTLDPVFYTPPKDRGVVQEGKAIEYDIHPGTYVQRSKVSMELEVNAWVAWKSYAEMLRKGIAREVARQVLPGNTMTTYYTSCNARSLMAFLELRGEGTHALWEIQQVAKGYQTALANNMPMTYLEFTWNGRKAP